MIVSYCHHWLYSNVKVLEKWINQEKIKMTMEKWLWIINLQKKE